jgi:hypothetical protein
MIRYRVSEYPNLGLHELNTSDFRLIVKFERLCPLKRGTVS